MVRETPNIATVLQRLARAEAELLRSEFVAPVVLGGAVRVRIGGEDCIFQPLPADFRGWGVFRPISHGVALLVKPASDDQRRQYLSLFPEVGKRDLTISSVGVCLVDAVE